jgi:hypothetical protein
MTTREAHLLPESLEVCGLPYSVTVQPMLEGDGSCHNARLALTVDADSAPEYQQATLLHEVLEALNDTHDMGLSHPQIATLAAELFAVLRHNPAWW